MAGKRDIRRPTYNPPKQREQLAYCEGREHAATGGSFTLSTAATGSVPGNSGITWSGGIGVVVNLIDPGANNAPLRVSAASGVVNIYLGTGAGGAITSTAAEVIAAVTADGLISAANTSTSTGAGVVAAESATLAGGDKRYPADPAGEELFAQGFISWTANPAPVSHKKQDACAHRYGGGYVE